LTLWDLSSAWSHAAISGSSGAMTWGIASITGHSEPLSMHLLGHLETDVTAAHNHGATGVAVFDPFPDPFHVGDVANGEVTRAIDAGNGWFERRGAGREHQRIVGLIVFALCRHLAHFDDLSCAIDGHDLGIDPHVEVEPGPEGFGGLEQERVLFDNLATHKIGQPAIGEGDVRPALENDDVAMFTEPPGTRGGAGAARDSAHDDETSRLHILCFQGAASRNEVTVKLEIGGFGAELGGQGAAPSGLSMSERRMLAARELIAIVLGIEAHGQAELAHLPEALDRTGGAARPTQRRQLP
jgi:hypothetical protein